MVTPKQAIAFVKANGIVLESARGPVPSLAEAIVGEPIHGSWWSHPRANEILVATRAVRAMADVLVCRLVDGKVTYVHRRLWPALVRLAGRFPADRLAALREVHTPTGKHVVQTIPLPEWVPEDVQRTAVGMPEEEAASVLSAVLARRQQAAKRPATAASMTSGNSPAVNDHFKDKDSALRPIYDVLLTAVRKFGPVGEDPKKTSIHLTCKTAFAGIQVRKGCLIVTIKADAPIDSPRVFKSEQASVHRYHHQVKLSSANDVDGELRGWLKQAYDLSG